MIRSIDKNNPDELMQVFVIQTLAFEDEARALQQETATLLYETLEDLEKSSDEIIVYFEGTEVMGAAFIDVSVPHTPIKKIAVDPSYTHLGIGRQLVDYCLSTKKSGENPSSDHSTNPASEIQTDPEPSIQN